MKLTDFHGVVSRCHCTNPDVPMGCKNCFSRGFVAVCLACSGTGQTTVPVAGAAAGDMKSTCDKCGGSGTFSVRKPDNWDEEHAPVVETVAVVEEDDDDAEKLFKEITAGATAEPEILGVEINVIGLSQGFTPESTVGEVFGGEITITAGPGLVEKSGLQLAIEEMNSKAVVVVDPKSIDLTTLKKPKGFAWRIWDTMGVTEKVETMAKYGMKPEPAKVETEELASV